MKAASLHTSAQERLRKYVLEHKMRPSRVRNEVLTQACRLTSPFTAEQLLEACEKEHISVGTVYNTLKLCVEAHILRATARQRGVSATEYEVITGTSSRMQLLCKKCGRVSEISDQRIAQMIKERTYSNFNMQNFSLFIYGECKVCRLKTIGRLKKTK